jgi:DNA helicase-2/ATP-dependent DNA helicase PcrA
VTELDPTQASIVADELAILQKVANHLYELAQQDQVPAKTDAAGSSYGEQMVSLRDQVGEARLEDVPALVAQMLQIASLMEGSRPKANVALDANSPYFGHLKLSEKGKQRDVLVGKQSMVSKGAGVAIVDWRNAPISRLYYCYHEGDEYEEEIAGRLMTGTVDARRSVSIAKGELKGIRCPQGTLTIHDHHWHAHENSEGPELKGGAGVAARPPVAGKKDWAPHMDRFAPTSIWLRSPRSLTPRNSTP